ncbi:2-hydroxymuconate semialdehyde hydrolase [Panacagrimonas perspica]|uniref:2-hydroxymuconate semialdehyde hydrolase n=1 Tax=Panacagrimonas perspica TaxID=381431 RepID=A0A4R7PG20_9GAMM|nr:alpha/beta fold hydrolase [Panacagrimonas perspica]TDU32591.1 2-hydroxymuconate semialdehyde hydrolase [Panacagrimonas perspica]THD05487.1 2-hydroxy-6-oxo-2,4-heptadienoate hydrolase [Panacagrimonas perspica]
MSEPTSNPEIGSSIVAAGIRTNLHDLNPAAPGVPLVLIHGSGPGVSAFANWRLVMPTFAKSRRVVAPDMVGFGFTDRPADHAYSLDRWVAHALGVLDALKLTRVDLVGNSFGGALSLALAVRHPQRVRRLVLMGAAGVDFELTPALDAVWGYTPSFENMRRLMDLFAYDRGLVNDELAELRYRASIRPGFQESFSAMFPAPRQRGIEALCSPEEQIRALPHETLVIHGREDQVIPMSNSLKLASLIPNAQLHIFGKCGHWTQIEHSARFARLVGDFLAEADNKPHSP